MREPKQDHSDQPASFRMGRGFYALLRQIPHHVDLQETWDSDNPLHFPEHPFGLPIREDPENPPYMQFEIRRYGGLACFITTLTKSLCSDQKPIALRVIETEAIDRERYKHDAYHEVTFPWMTIIHDKTTDYSGGGGWNKCELDGLFLLLSHVFDLEIETVVIRFDRAQQIRQRILDASIAAGIAASRARSSASRNR